MATTKFRVTFADGLVLTVDAVDEKDAIVQAHLKRFPKGKLSWVGKILEVTNIERV